MESKEKYVAAYNKICNEAVIAHYYDGTALMDVCKKQLELFKNLIKENFDPYKYQELKEGMLVYSEEINTICLILEFYYYDIVVVYLEFHALSNDYNPRREVIHFADDSIFPITKYLEYQK